MKPKDFDVIIIGGGVAGLSAAIWCDELGLRAIILETENELGGQLRWTYNPIKNYLGLETENGRELQKVFLKQLQARKSTVKTDSKVIEIDTADKQVGLENGESFSARALIIATGIRRRKLNLEGEDHFQGRGILESGAREAEQIKGKSVCIVGGGDAALENALILAEFAKQVTLIHRRPDFRARPEFIGEVKNNPKITILSETIVKKLLGQVHLEALELQNLKTNETFIKPLDALLLRLGVEPNTELLRPSLQLDKDGYCQVNAHGETILEGVFAIGDVANPLAPTISGASGMGATAAKVIYHRLREDLA